MKIFLLTVLAFCSISASAQRFDSVLNVLDTKYPQEKMYLHFDKSMYSPGETIWFKAYMFSGAFPSLISKTIYAELVDEQGKILQRVSAPVTQSSSAAAFDIPGNLKSQMLFVRAYTRWMLNFDTSFLFVKPIPVVNKNKAASATVTPPSAFLQFFPEGGELVTGLQSRVAFKATDGRGLPVDVKGEVVTSSGQKVVSFSSSHNGMGYFMLQPAAGEQYKARWKDPNGKEQETALPAQLSKGIVVKMDNLGDKANFTIYRTSDVPPGGVYIVAQMQQQLLYRAKANMGTRMVANGVIPLSDLPAGIIQVTLFDENEMPLAERLIFVNRDDYYFITDLNAASKNLTKRGKNVIQIDVPDTLACNLSVSVTDAGLNPAQKGEEDIFSRLLLTSDIKGYVHQPAYYFSGSDSAAAHLDLVMMTNGWRRFKWEDALAGRWPDIQHQPEGYPTIYGKVSGINKSSLLQKTLVGMFETKNAGKQVLAVPVLPDGTFKIEDAIFFDTARIFYQFNNDKDKTLTSRGVFEFKSSLLNSGLRIKPDLAFTPIFDSLLMDKNADFAERRETEEERRRKVQTLATVVVKARAPTREEKLDDEYTSGMFSGDGHMFVVADDPAAQTALSLFSYLQGRVPGLMIRPSATEPGITWRDEVPGLFLDEQPMDAASLQSLPMSSIAFIKVFNPPFFGNFSGGTSGAIAVYTKKGRMAMDQVKGLDVTRVVGYSPIKEFYSPDYSKYNAAADDVDLRTTLYWNPFVLTDKQNRRIMLTFYNNDITKRIRVVVEGINLDGKLTRIEKIFE